MHCCVCMCVYACAHRYVHRRPHVRVRIGRSVCYVYARAALCAQHAFACIDTMRVCLCILCICICARGYVLAYLRIRMGLLARVGLYVAAREV